MSFEEMETAWREQTVNRDEHGARQWLIKTRRSYVVTTASLSFGVGISVAVLVLKLTVLNYDSTRTLWNSSLDLCLSLAVCMGTLIGVRQYLRQRREFEALSDNLPGCLDAMIKAARREIHETHCFGPIIVLSVLFVLALPKWQSITHGFETPAGALAVMAMAVVMFILAGAFVYRRLNAFVKPRLEALEACRQQFD